MHTTTLNTPKGWTLKTFKERLINSMNNSFD